MSVTEGRIQYEIIKPDPLISDFIENFWMLANDSEESQEIAVLPDGRIDLFFSLSASEPFRIMLMPLDSEPSNATIEPKSIIFAVSFTLLSVEYLLEPEFSFQPGIFLQLAENLWGISRENLNDFKTFVRNITGKIIPILRSKIIDERKRQLFKLIYASNGSMPVKEISEKAFWSSRQINRYFSQHIGLSLKSYCNILRFRASFKHISKGKLFPEENFTDQNHFIKEVKRFAGVLPKVLSKNKDGRFVQITAAKHPLS